MHIEHHHGNKSSVLLTRVLVKPFGFKKFLAAFASLQINGWYSVHTTSQRAARSVLDASATYMRTGGIPIGDQDLNFIGD